MTRKLNLETELLLSHGVFQISDERSSTPFEHWIGDSPVTAVDDGIAIRAMSSVDGPVRLLVRLGDSLPDLDDALADAFVGRLETPSGELVLSTPDRDTWVRFSVPLDGVEVVVAVDVRPNPGNLRIDLLIPTEA